MLIYLVDAEKLQAWVSRVSGNKYRVLRVPFWGRGLLVVFIARYLGGYSVGSRMSLPRFQEAAYLPVVFHRARWGLHFADIQVNHEIPLRAWHRYFGYPKEIAEVSYGDETARIRAEISRAGEPLLSLEARKSDGFGGRIAAILVVSIYRALDLGLGLGRAYFFKEGRLRRAPLRVRPRLSRVSGVTIESAEFSLLRRWGILIGSDALRPLVAAHSSESKMSILPAADLGPF